MLEFILYVMETDVYSVVMFSQRFFPSEFGNDVDRVHAVEPAKTAFATKAKIRRAIEAEGIPYTYVSSNFFAGYFLPNLAQPGATAAPRDKVVIQGDGNPKGRLHFSPKCFTVLAKHLYWLMDNSVVFS